MVRGLITASRGIGCLRWSAVNKGGEGAGSWSAGNARHHTTDESRYCGFSRRLAGDQYWVLRAFTSIVRKTTY